MVQGSAQSMPQFLRARHGRFALRRSHKSRAYPRSTGYYDGVIFHRIVPGFIAQTGDPSGTGMGGESYYGEPFENETHSRLKFNRFVVTTLLSFRISHRSFPPSLLFRRGLIAFANNGDKCSNTSQWFITLGMLQLPSFRNHADLLSVAP